ncbi:inhibin alpha chain [Sardina pilchardus]|uniref:inhibin alpha chain n=1 Tax=Sardina pilchardus TaxID=27697 RepID=UPI002E103ABD
MWIHKPVSRAVLSAFCHLALWLSQESEACPGDELPRELLLGWVKTRILEGLRLEEAPKLPEHRPQAENAEPEHALRRRSRHSRGDLGAHSSRQRRDISEVILFPTLDSTCVNSPDDPSSSSETPANGFFTYYFQPSLDNKETSVTSARFWFYAGEAVNAPVYILTTRQELLKVSDTPNKRGEDGWTIYHLEKDLHQAVAEGPFILQVRCSECACLSSEQDKTPFVHLHTKPKSPERTRRAPLIPWSPAALDILQRTSSEKTDPGNDCHLQKIEISFAELGWDNWIVHPKEFTFNYCHGTCANSQRSQVLGIKQCCAPVPGTMKSLRFTTTSDGGLSFKYETLPNIIPEECTCI